MDVLIAIPNPHEPPTPLALALRQYRCRVLAKYGQLDLTVTGGTAASPIPGTT